MTKYRIYVDEVGNPDLKSSNLKDHRFLCLTGVIIDISHVNEIIQNDLTKIKNCFFKSDPDDPIILHRKEIIYKKGPFSVLKDPDTENRFNDQLLFLLDKWDYTVIAVVIDKLEHNQRYSTWKYDPYHYCQEILIERFRLFLNIKKAVGDIMFESRGSKEDMRLKKSFRFLNKKSSFAIMGI